MDEEMREFLHAEQRLQAERYRTCAAQFREAARETHEQWRLGMQHVKSDYRRERYVFRECFRDIVRLRLTSLYLPMFLTLDRIERDCVNIAKLV